MIKIIKHNKTHPDSGLHKQYNRRDSVTMTTENSTNGATTFTNMNFSGYVG